VFINLDITFLMFVCLSSLHRGLAMPFVEILFLLLPVWSHNGIRVWIFDISQALEADLLHTYMHRIIRNVH